MLTQLPGHGDSLQGCPNVHSTESLQGCLQDALLANQSAASTRAAFAPKAGALATLAPHLRTHALGQVAVFSSVAGLLGSSGQANYAAANATLDAMALDMQSQVGRDRALLLLEHSLHLIHSWLSALRMHVS